MKTEKLNKFEQLREKAHKDVKANDELIDALFNVVYFVNRIMKDKKTRERLREEYPPGTCNAEDAWHEFAQESDKNEKGLEEAMKYLEKL